ncbi:thiol reductant ABC exporter subunit CydC [Devosia pacifica]|uniref:Thiol reductant ABC exporter subunit CydC n=1 Tax=Devosia pacifica TaxID=1335967 RepID=A0A918S0W3_9HYPH|nr:thiol reductant ABC exporter subunit CydC [Devosia pacifica]GHA18643.1 thiol reductant ABC exporter subunit CydC [Devosia pacifica]
MKTLRLLLPLLRPHWRGFLLSLALTILTLAAGAALLGVSGWFLTATALTGLGLSFNLFAPSAAVRGLSFTRIVSRYFEKLVGHNATLRLLSDLRRWLFSSLFPKLPFGAKALPSGDLLGRLTGDVDAVDTLLLSAIGPAIGAIVISTTTTIVLAMILPAAAPIYAGAIVGAIVLVPTLLFAATRKFGRTAVAAASTMRVQTLEALEGAEDITWFGQQGPVLGRFIETCSQSAAARGFLGSHVALATFAVHALAGIALFATLLCGLEALAQENVSGPILAGALLAILASFEASNALVRATAKLGTGVAAAQRLQALVSLAPNGTEPRNPREPETSPSLVFDNVSFGYGGNLVLDHADLAVAPGERVAISGPSGCGKSTLLSLVLRLNDPLGGTVSVGGEPTTWIATETLYKSVCLLSQQSPVFLDTVRNNLRIAAPEAGDEELWQALDAARLGTTIRALPQGLDTLLGEDATSLSAGQARRLCLARVLLSQASIVLLDEPTAGLDRATELELFHQLPQILEGRSVIMVTHASIPETAGYRRLVLRDAQLSEVS